MKVRMRRHEEPEIILIPLIDILLMRLIFFMLATTFKQAAKIAIHLPEAAQREVPTMGQQTLEVVIDAQGHFFIDRQALVNSDLTSVKCAMQQAVGARTEQGVTISADAHSVHQSVVTAMDAPRQFRLLKIGIAMQQSKVPAN